MQTIAVSGASGRLGRLVVQNLIAQHAQEQRKIILTTRTPENLMPFIENGIDIRHADFDMPETLAKAFVGAKRLLLISTDVLDGSGRRTQQHQHAIAAARRAGVEHIVYTSFLQPRHDLPMPPAVDHKATEQLLQKSGIGYTVLRHAFYMDMLLPMLTQAQMSGILESATGTARIAYVHRIDCAKAATAALLDDFSGQRTFEIIGQTVNAEELAEIAARACSKGIRYKAITTEEREASFVRQGLPPSVAHLLSAIDISLAKGALDIYSDDIRQLSGEAPLSISEALKQ